MKFYKIRYSISLCYEHKWFATKSKQNKRRQDEKWINLRKLGPQNIVKPSNLVNLKKLRLSDIGNLRNK